MSLQAVAHGPAPNPILMGRSHPGDPTGRPRMAFVGAAPFAKEMQLR